MRTLMILLLLTSPALAEDTGSTMAALKDEKAECRYLAQLCKDASPLQRQMADALAVNNDAIARTKSLVGQWGVSRSDLADAQAAMDATYAQFHAAVIVFGNKRLEIKSATDVMKAKHDKAPKCFAECRQIDGDGELVSPPPPLD